MAKGTRSQVKNPK